jgi:drug/metabolite transporter (DMT)-like permease
MKGFQYLIISGICLGTIGIFVKLVGPDISPFLLTAIRAISAAGLILAFLVSDRKTSILKLREGELLKFLVAGFFGVVFGLGFFIKSLTLIPVANAVFLVYVYPIATAILARLFLGERFGKFTALALAIAFSGIYLIYGHGANLFTSAEGSFYALMAGLGYSVFIITMRYMEKKGHSFWDAAFWPLLLGGLMLIPMSFTENVVFLPFQDTILWIAGLVFVSTFLGYVFYAKGLKTVQAKHATIIETLAEPSSAVFMAWLILGEVVPPYIFLGGFLIILANLIVRLDIADEEHRKRI